MPHDATMIIADSPMTPHDATSCAPSGNDLLIRRSRVRNPPGSLSYTAAPAPGAGKSAGRYLNTAGYVMVLAPGHPHADRDGYVREHVLLAAAALGRALPAGAPVHHVDENRANNAQGNLVLCQDVGYHMLLHQRQRALNACGDPNAIRCGLCCLYDRQDDMQVWAKARGGVVAYHRDCRKRSRSKGTAKPSFFCAPVSLPVSEGVSNGR